MKLIADSGSTKTDWRLVDSNNKIESFQTIGFNPYHISNDEILAELNKSTLKSVKQEIKEVVFYGAGCSSPAKSNEIKKALQQFFIQATVSVDHDLLAAARALCGHGKGMVAILGTGSNTCLFDGENITANVSALGYILGDEGSGSYIGKTFIQALLNKELSKEMEDNFKQQYNLTLTDVLDAVYKKPLPNRFLAQFAKFIYENKTSPEITTLIENCFQAFFEKHICKYENYQQYPLNIVGSIGFVFKNEIENVAKNYNVKIGKVIKQPIDELVKFHS
ncbi:MAG: BadF/BadG/BcrA/BcrD ATPase family protein [Flavobacteriales bacterium]